jgi:cyclophilin family peptidyl-prolyl cis-trans isomerase
MFAPESRIDFMAADTSRSEVKVYARTLPSRQHPEEYIEYRPPANSSMNITAKFLALLALPVCLPALAGPPEGRPPGRVDTPSSAQILAESSGSEWRRPDPEDLLVMRLRSGRIVMELDPDYAPLHVANIRTLVREHYFDGVAIVRVQDDFVAQWDDPAAIEGGEPHEVRRSLGRATATLPPEFTRSMAASLPWVPLPDGDVYAPEVGFTDDFPAARDPVKSETWLVHCYGTLAVGRNDPQDSGNGSELYVAIGQAPRRLDRNLTVVGRVLEGMEHLSALPRGHGPMGFYARPESRPPILDIRVAADLPPARRPNIEILRTDSRTFQRLLAATRNRHDKFYRRPPGKVDVCAVSAPVRALANR